MKAAHLRPLRRVVANSLSPAQQARRIERTGPFYQRYLLGERWRTVLWSDEKLWTVLPPRNTRNDVFYVDEGVGKRDVPQQRVTRPSGQFSAGFHVWAGISDAGKTELVFFPRAVRFNSQLYCDTVIDQVVHPAMDALFGGNGVLQQDGAPSHTALWTQEHLHSRVRSWFINVAREKFLGHKLRSALRVAAIQPRLEPPRLLCLGCDDGKRLPHAHRRCP